MIEYLVKTATLYASYEPLPESYIQADLSQIQQLIHHLDPFETGFLSWRKFMILNARLIPVEMEAIVDAKAQFMRISGYPFLTLVEFKEVHLWFEPPVGTTRRGFDRPTKLKETLFGISY
jgi:hypothetical protein